MLDRVVAAGALILTDAEGPYLDGVPSDLRPLVEEYRAELRALLAEPPAAGNLEPAASAPAMPSLTRDALARFAAEGDAVAFRVPWSEPVLLWWAPTVTEAQRLIAWGIAAPGAVWTPGELETLIGLVGPEARAVVTAKLATDGVIVEARSR